MWFLPINFPPLQTYLLSLTWEDDASSCQKSTFSPTSLTPFPCLLVVSVGHPLLRDFFLAQKHAQVCSFTSLKQNPYLILRSFLSSLPLLLKFFKKESLLSISIFFHCSHFSYCHLASLPPLKVLPIHLWKSSPSVISWVIDLKDKNPLVLA